MSRSNPTQDMPNPCTRWIEWNGGKGTLGYYDKTKKENVDIGSKFTFIWLDELGCIKGWHDSSESGIYSNEIRDTRDEPFVVKAFKGGVLAQGIYKTIRDRVVAAGGHFTSNCYVGYKNGDGALSIGSIQFKGVSLRSWMEFRKEHRGELDKKAIRINGFTEGKKGTIVYRVPVFSIADITPETNNEAIEIDKELQVYLNAYFSRTRVEQVAQSPNASRSGESVDSAQPAKPDDNGEETPFDQLPDAGEYFQEDDIPF